MARIPRITPGVAATTLRAATGALQTPQQAYQQEAQPWADFAQATSILARTGERIAQERDRELREQEDLQIARQKEFEKTQRANAAAIMARTAAEGEAALDAMVVRGEFVSEDDIMQYRTEALSQLNALQVPESYRTAAESAIDTQVIKLRGHYMAKNVENARDVAEANFYDSFDTLLNTGQYDTASALLDATSDSGLYTPEQRRGMERMITFGREQQHVIDLLGEQPTPETIETAQEYADGILSRRNIKASDKHSLRGQLNEMINSFRVRMTREVDETRNIRQGDARVRTEAYLQLRKEQPVGQARTLEQMRAEAKDAYDRGVFGSHAEVDAASTSANYVRVLNEIEKEYPVIEARREIVTGERFADPGDDTDRTALTREYDYLRSLDGLDDQSAALLVADQYGVVPDEVVQRLTGGLRVESGMSSSITEYSRLRSASPGAAFPGLSNVDRERLEVGYSMAKGIGAERAAQYLWTAGTVDEPTRQARAAQLSTTMAEDDFYDSLYSARPDQFKAPLLGWNLEVEDMPPEMTGALNALVHSAYMAYGDLDGAIQAGWAGLAAAGWRYSTLNEDAQDAVGDDWGTRYIRTRIAEDAVESVRRALASDPDIKGTRFEGRTDELAIVDPPRPVLQDGVQVFLLFENNAPILDEDGNAMTWHWKKAE